ncbi:MAG: DUF6285 domain-containing protein [Myxococcota bacterium]
MQQRPDPSTLLDAVCSFLLTEVAPKIDDKALSFRVMIAANLANIVSQELRTDEKRLSDELQRLQAILPDVTGDASQLRTRAERLAALDTLNRALARGLRERHFSGAQMDTILEHVRVTTLETLAVTNPRFDASDEIE